MGAAGIILCGVILAAAVIAILYFGNFFDFQVNFDALTAQIPKIDILKLITQNWGTIATVGIPLVIAGVSYYKYKIELTAKQKLLELEKQAQLGKMNAESEAASAAKSTSTKIQQLEAELQQYKGDANSVQQSYSQLQTQNNRLQNDLQSLTSIHNQSLQELWTSTGSKLWKDPSTGETYRVLEIVKKVVT